MNDTKDLLLPPPLALVELTAGKGSGDDGRACKGRRQAGCRSEPEYPAHNHRFLRTSDATGGTLSPQCLQSKVFHRLELPRIAMLPRERLQRPWACTVHLHASACAVHQQRVGNTQLAPRRSEKMLSSVRGKYDGRAPHCTMLVNTFIEREHILWIENTFKSASSPPCR
jgi:hypothetical protein